MGKITNGKMNLGDMGTRHATGKQWSERALLQAHNVLPREKLEWQNCSFHDETNTTPKNTAKFRSRSSTSQDK
jgi:hypothetical protein